MRSAEGMFVLCALEEEIPCLIIKRPLPLVSPVVVDERISHNREQPSFQISVFTEFFTIGESFEHGILDKITRFFPVQSKSPRKSQQGAAKSGKLVAEFYCCHIMSNKM